MNKKTPLKFLKRQKKFIRGALLISLLILAVYGFIWISMHGIIVQGSSMEPYIYHNDLIIIEAREPGKIEIGEIVVLKSLYEFWENGGEPVFSEIPNDTKIVHQVYDKKELNGTWYFATKGSNNLLIDGSIRKVFESEGYILYEHNASNPVFISESSILGVMVFKVPFVGYIREISLWSVISIIIYLGLRKGFKYISRKKKLVKIRSERKYKHSKNWIPIELLIVGLIGIQISIPFIQNTYLMNNESLSPTLIEGDLVIAPHINGNDIQIGDIVVIENASWFYNQGFDFIWWRYPTNRYFLHRVCDKKQINDTWYFSTKGDYLYQPYLQVDGTLRTLNKTGYNDYSYFLVELNISNPIFIPKKAILGVVSYKIPYLGQIYSIGWFLLLVDSVIYSLLVSFKIRGIQIKFVPIPEKNVL